MTKENIWYHVEGESYKWRSGIANRLSAISFGYMYYLFI